MKRYDAIVVGAGPAGSTAAYRLASAGADVLLLDRARFPRDKPCGGGVTGRAARLLPFSVEPVVEHVVSAVDLRLRYGKSLARGNGDPLVYMTQRKRLDHFLVQKAVEAGAELRDGVKVSDLEVRADGVAVEGIEADVLIGADGVNGVTARTLGLGGNRVVGVALEANMPYAKMDRSAYDGRLALELGVVPGGYGWVFPKGDHANFGVGGWEEEGPRLRAHLRRLCEAHGASFDDLEELRGYRLPLREPGSTLAAGPRAPRRRRGGTHRPGLRRRNVRGLPELAVRLRGRSRRPSRPDGEPGPVRAAHGESPGEPSVGLVGSEGRPRPLPAGDVRPRQHEARVAVVERLVRGEVADVGGIKGLARPPLKAIALLARAAGDPGRAYRHV